MLRLTLLGFALVMALYGVGAGAASRGPVDMACQDYRELRRQLALSYHEHPVSTALAADGRLLQVFASEELQTWTMLSVGPRGSSCLLATGRAWQASEAPAAVLDS